MKYIAVHNTWPFTTKTCIHKPKTVGNWNCKQVLLKQEKVFSTHKNSVYNLA